LTLADLMTRRIVGMGGLDFTQHRRPPRSNRS
jgi:hypothetical protein